MKKRWLSFLLALVIAFGAGAVSYRVYDKWKTEQSLCREMKELQLRMSRCYSVMYDRPFGAPHASEKANAYDRQAMGTVPGGMIARIHDRFGNPPYQSDAVAYLYGMAHFMCTAEFSTWDKAQWEQFWIDTAPVLAMRTFDDLDRDILEPLETAYDSAPIPEAFQSSYVVYIPEDFY